MVPLKRLEAAHIKRLKEVGGVRRKGKQLNLMLVRVLNELVGDVRCVSIHKK